MKISSLAELPADPQLQYWIYSALDSAVTIEIYNQIEPMLESMPHARRSYEFDKSLQPVALAMMQRGILVDIPARDSVLIDLKFKQEKVQQILNRFAQEVWGQDLNPRSPAQLKKFFYEVLQLPEQFAFVKGARKVSTNQDALDNLRAYFIAQPFVNCIEQIRGYSKIIGVLRSDVSYDNRMRTSYNITGTETKRWSSSANAYKEGTNLQNITGSLRHIFIADKGKKLAYIDLQAAESLGFGALCWAAIGEDTYWEAARTGDIHTIVTRMVWPHLPWPKAQADWPSVAKTLFYRHFSHRDIAKRGGHGSNYYGKPPTIARHLKVPTQIVEKFQEDYFTAFPEIPKYHKWVAKELQLKSFLDTPMGFGRIFFGRSRDDATLRKAIAYRPQSLIATILNQGMKQVFNKFHNQIDMLGQVHDAIIIQYPEEREDELIPQIMKEIIVRVPVFHGKEERELVIGVDVEVGWNWGKASLENPNGLEKYKGKDLRVRYERKNSPLLDIRVY